MMALAARMTVTALALLVFALAFSTNPASAEMRASLPWQSPDSWTCRYDWEGRTALHLAAASGDEWRVDLKLKIGENPNALDKHGVSVLSLGVYSKNPRVVASLLKAGALTNWGKLNPLFVAFAQESTEIVELLEQYGAQIDKPGKDRAVALQNRSLSIPEMIEVGTQGSDGR